MWVCLPIVFAFVILVLIIELINKLCMHYLSSKLTLQLRKDLYDRIIKQPIEFFNSRSLSTGNLTGMLAQEIKAINASTVQRYLLLLQGLFALITGLIISLIYSWKIGLVASVMLPTIMLLIYLHLKQSKVEAANNTGLTEISRLIISDSILNHTTVAVLANEQILIDRYFKQRKSIWRQIYQAFKVFVYMALCEISMVMVYFPLYQMMATGIENNGKLQILKHAL